MKVNKTNTTSATNFNAKFLVTGSTIEKGRANLNVLRDFLMASGEDMEKIHVEEIKNPISYAVFTQKDMDEFSRGLVEIETKKPSSIMDYYQRKIEFVRDFVKGAKTFGDKQAEAIQEKSKRFLDEL